MSQHHHKSAVLSILISFKGTGENQLQPGQESVGDTPVLSHCYLIRNPTTYTDWCAGALSWRNQLLVLHFKRCFLPTTCLRRRKISMYISLLIVENTVNYTSEFRKMFEATTCNWMSNCRWLTNRGPPELGLHRGKQRLNVNRNQYAMKCGTWSRTWQDCLTG